MEFNYFVYANKHLHINKTHFQIFTRFSFLFKAHPRSFFRHFAQIVQVADWPKKREWRDEAGEWIVGERSFIDAFDFFECKPLELKQRERLRLSGVLQTSKRSPSRQQSSHLIGSLKGVTRLAWQGELAFDFAEPNNGKILYTLHQIRGTIFELKSKLLVDCLYVETSCSPCCARTL